MARPGRMAQAVAGTSGWAGPVVLAVFVLALVACATAGPDRAAEPAETRVAVAPRETSAPPPAPEPLPEAFESERFVVTFAKPGDTPATLAQRYLGSADKAWMIEEYAGTPAFGVGQPVVIPKFEWNPAGVERNGYQLVPILVYHNIGPQPKGRLVLGAKTFEEQMRYLKAQGFHVITLSDFVSFTQLRRQLPRKAVVLTFDDGYRSFKEFAYPLLKELGFPATLFVYTDYIGAGRNALSWTELQQLQAEGFDVQAHSKTHGDLRRETGEGEAQYARRLDAELVQPIELFRRHLGRTPDVVAYPHGRVDDAVVARSRAAGYVAGFTVRRQSNAAFVSPLRSHRGQIYADMSLEEFARNLTVFEEVDLR